MKTVHEGIGMTSRRTRQRLIKRLRDEGIKDERVLSVMEQIPRHIFVDEALASRAYEDTALPIGHNQTISQPFVVGLMTEMLLNSGPTPRSVLEIGTGSGYQTAVLGRLVEQVYSVERIEVLQRQAMNRLYDLRVKNVKYLSDDGTIGWQEFAPYDGILVTAAPTDIPDALLEQLADGGRLISPVGEQSRQRLVVITREDDVFTQQEHDWVRFVPLMSGRV